MEENNKETVKTEKKNKINKKTVKNILQGVLCGLVITAIFFAGYLTHYFSLSKELRSIEFILDTYKEHYYKADEQDLLHTLADGILDMYSGYYTAEEYEAYLKDGQGSKSGYGIAISSMKVARVIGNSPAELAGIKVGGVIKEYKKESDAEYTVATEQSLFTNFLASTNECVNLKIEYSGEIKTFSLTRAEYTENNVFYTDNTGNYRYNTVNGEMALVSYEGDTLNLGDGWGYIKFTSFNGLQGGYNGASGQFAGALELFKRNNNKKLIIDLRDNGGGYMSILCNIATYLCDNKADGKFVAQMARYKDGKTSCFYAEKSKYSEYNFESIVFIANNGSASASEALMGAVLDYDRASANNIVKVVLAKNASGNLYGTYGKGIMQSTYTNVLTGEALKLTTAEVLWPTSGTCIHGVGITTETDERVFEGGDDPVAFAQTL